MSGWQTFLRTFRATKSSSDRTFGVFFAALFLFLGARHWHYYRELNTFWLALSAVFLVVGLILPRALHPLNRAWTFLGLFLGFFVSPVVIGFIYWGIFTPFAAGARLFRGDHLGLKLDRDTNTYWTQRAQGEEEPERFRLQF